MFEGANAYAGSRSCTTVSVKPPLPVNWLRLSLVPLPVLTCRSCPDASVGRSRLVCTYLHKYLDLSCKIRLNLSISLLFSFFSGFLFSFGCVFSIADSIVFCTTCTLLVCYLYLVKATGPSQWLSRPNVVQPAQSLRYCSFNIH